MNQDAPTAVVTGGTGGIGTAVTTKLTRSGYRVVALGRDTDRLDELAERHPEVTPVLVDLTDPAALAEAMSAIPRLDALVHCAGIADVAEVGRSDAQHWRRIFEVNLIATADLTRLLLPALRRARGHVVFVNSSYGMTGVPGWSAYVGSKAALRELADSLRVEEARHGVRVTSVFPGGVATDLLRQVRQSLDSPYDPAACISPDSLADVLVSTLRTPADVVITDLAVAPAPRG